MTSGQLPFPVLPVRLTISRTTSSHRGDRIAVRITDELSGISFVELSLPLAAFAAAVTGMGDVHAEAEIHGLDLIGQKHESKTETVPFDPSQLGYGAEKGAFTAMLTAAVAPFEVDGWKADLDRTYNMHRVRDGMKGYEVHFHRYVEATEDNIAEKRKNRREYGAPWED